MSFKSVPNLLTMLRILIIPIICFSFYIDGRLGQIIGASAFALAGFTDYLDGYIARKFKFQTKFGTAFDPIADKLLVASSLVMLTFMHKVSPASCIIIISREIFISGIREVTSDQKFSIPVSFLSKIKTAIQFIAIFVLILSNKDSDMKFIFQLGTILIWIAAFLSLYTGYEHYKSVANKISPY